MSTSIIPHLQYRYYPSKEPEQPLLLPPPLSLPFTYETNTFPLEILDQYLPSKTFPLENSTSTVQYILLIIILIINYIRVNVRKSPQTTRRSFL